MGKYRYLLITFDVVANTVSDVYHQTILVRLYAYFFQDLFLLFSLLLILLQFFRDDILRARLLGPMIARHWSLLAISLSYIVLTLSWQMMHGTYTLEDRESIHVSKGRLIHSLIHRLTGVMYYFVVAKMIKFDPPYEQRKQGTTNNEQRTPK